MSSINGLMEHLQNALGRGDQHAAKQLVEIIKHEKEKEAKMAMSVLGPPPAVPWNDQALFPPASRPHNLEEMLAMRMRWGTLGGGSQWAKGFMHVATHSCNDQVHIWIITLDGTSVVLQDEMSLYPSDALITKLNMIAQGKQE